MKTTPSFIRSILFSARTLLPAAALLLFGALPLHAQQASPTTPARVVAAPPVLLYDITDPGGTAHLRLFDDGLLRISGMVESMAGGFRFPDGTVQSTAATGGGSLWGSDGDAIHYSTGSVGIGIDGPAGPLHVLGTGGTAHTRIESNSALGTWLNLVNTSDGGDAWNLISTGSGNDQGSGALLFHNGSTRLGLFSNGHLGVGLGGDTPAGALHVRGTGGTAHTRIESNSPVGTWLNLVNASAGGAQWNLISTGSGNSQGAGALLFHNGSARLTMQPNGRVGIGVSDPQALLHLGGSAGVDGIRFPDGTLQTTAAGGGGSGPWTDAGSDLFYEAGLFGIGTNAPGSVVASSILDVVGGHIAVGNNFGVLSYNSAGTGIGAGFDTSPSDGLDLIAGGRRVMRFEPGNSPNVIGGHAGNNVRASVLGATIAGGGSPDILAGYPGLNQVLANFGTVGGGFGNTAGGNWSTIGGGLGNRTGTHYSTVGGGSQNVASGHRSTVPGGDRNTASGEYSFAAGHRANATHEGAFVWADHQEQDFSSFDPNTFNVRASGGFYYRHGQAADASTTWPFRIANPFTSFVAGMRVTNDGFFDVTNHAPSSSGFARLTNTGNWGTVSDRRLKQDITPATGLLAGVMQIQPARYRFRDDATGALQLGLIAQEVQAVFPEFVTEGDVLTLNYAGLSAVALGAIREQQAEIDALRQENDQLHRRLDALEARFDTSSASSDR